VGQQHRRNDFITGANHATLVRRRVFDNRDPGGSVHGFPGPSSQEQVGPLHDELGRRLAVVGPQVRFPVALVDGGRAPARRDERVRHHPVVHGVPGPERLFVRRQVFAVGFGRAQVQAAPLGAREESRVELRQGQLVGDLVVKRIFQIR